MTQQWVIVAGTRLTGDYHGFDIGEQVRLATIDEIEQHWGGRHGDDSLPDDELYWGYETETVQHLLPEHIQEIPMSTTKATAAKATDVLDDIFDILNNRRTEAEGMLGEIKAEAEAKPKATLTATDWEEDGHGHKSKSVPFSQLFWIPKHYPDHLVRVFEGYDSQPVMDMYIPPIREFELLSLAFSLKQKVNVIGPTGCGKTQMMEYYAAQTGRPYLRIQHDESFDKTEVFGQVHITEGDTDFIPGLLPCSMDDPTLVILDELTRNTGGSNMVYQRLLDRMELALPELKDSDKAVIVPHGDWLVCASDNTKGNGEDLDKYPMSNVQDGAFLNRWDMIIEQDYLTQVQEETLMKALAPKMTVSDRKALCKFSALIHAGYNKGDINTAFSPRNLMAIAKLVGAGISTQEAIQINYVTRCAKSELSDIHECIRSTFGGKE